MLEKLRHMADCRGSIPMTAKRVATEIEGRRVGAMSRWKATRHQ
jgi:hypothetical protein